MLSPSLLEAHILLGIYLKIDSIIWTFFWKVKYPQLPTKIINREWRVWTTQFKSYYMDFLIALAKFCQDLPLDSVYSIWGQIEKVLLYSVSGSEEAYTIYVT